MKNKIIEARYYTAEVYRTSRGAAFETTLWGSSEEELRQRIHEWIMAHPQSGVLRRWVHHSIGATPELL